MLTELVEREVINKKWQIMKMPGKQCITVWLEEGIVGEFNLEARRLGMTRSQVLRQLIKGFLIRRKQSGKRHPLEVEL